MSGATGRPGLRPQAILEPWASVRADFPYLEPRPGASPTAYLDSASSAQKPREVLDAVRAFEERSYANVHRGIYWESEEATRLHEEARGAVASFIGAEDPACCLFTRGTTESLNLVAWAWADQHLKAGDELVLSVLEHHANLIPWQQLALRRGVRLRWVELGPEGRLDLESYARALEGRPRLVALSWVSNVFGTIHPVAELTRMAHEAGAVVVLDGAQGVPHLPARVEELGADFLAFSGHKMLAPTGIGVLWGRRERLEEMTPWQFGGGMIGLVRRDRCTWADLPNRFEPGTPNISGAIGLGAACRYLERLGMDRVQAHDLELLDQARARLAGFPGLELLGPAEGPDRSGVLSFRLEGVHPHDVATVLARRGVCVRAGHHCCQPLMREIGMEGTTRASFYVYNHSEEIDRLVAGLEEAARLLGRGAL